MFTVEDTEFFAAVVTDEIVTAEASAVDASSVPTAFAGASMLAAIGSGEACCADADACYTIPIFTTLGEALLLRAILAVIVAKALA